MNKSNFHTVHIQPSFEKFLKEDFDGPVATGVAHVGAIDGAPAADQLDKGGHQVQDDEVLDRLNAFLAAVNQQQYLNPYSVIQRMRDKLSIVGLHFDDILLVGDSGSISKPLTQFGGRFGQLDNSGDIKQDDGISHLIPGGLKLKISWFKFQGLTTLNATIVPGESGPASPIAEG